MKEEEADEEEEKESQAELLGGLDGWTQRLGTTSTSWKKRSVASKLR